MTTLALTVGLLKDHYSMTTLAPQPVAQEMPDQAHLTALTKRLAKAKTSLILEHPFVGTVAMNMPFMLTVDVPTAATNGKKVMFNPHFVDTLTDEELTFLTAHECMHPMLEHNYRRHERTHTRWNHAADYVINKLLTDEGIGKMPDCGLLSDDIYNDGGGTTDGIYHILPEMEDDPNGGNGSGMDECMDGEGTQQDQDQQAAEMRVTVAQAAQAAKMMGKLSAGMEKLVEEVLNPKVDWRDVLQQFVVKCKSDSRSWARPNRRFISQGIYLPERSGESMGPLVFAVDCSGSCWGDIPQFANEVRTVFEDFKPRELHVIYFDSSVSHCDKFEPDDEFHMEGHGGGGTAFSPIFEKVEELGVEAEACIILTDLCCHDFGDEPEYPVLWVSTANGEAPFGEVVMM